MATRTTIGNGDWSDTDNWQDGIIPVAGDDVVISHTIILDVERIPATESLNSLKNSFDFGSSIQVSMTDLDAPEIHALSVEGKSNDGEALIYVNGNSEDKTFKIVSENIKTGPSYSFCLYYAPSVAGTLHLIGNISCFGEDNIAVDFEPTTGEGKLIIDGNILGCAGSNSACIIGRTRAGASTNVIINGNIAPLLSGAQYIFENYGVLFYGEGIDITIIGNISSDGFVDENSSGIVAVTLPAESVVTIIGDMTSAPFLGCYAVSVEQPSVLSFDGSLIFNEGVPPLYCGGGYGTVVFIGGNNRYIQIYDTIFPLQLATSFGSNPFRRFRRLA
jgi:hypothetical protein